MEHKHEGIIGNDDLIRCRLCGQVLSHITETISRVSSARRAKKILENIAVAGKYMAIGFNDGFIVYLKHKGIWVEEITARKIGERDFEVTKKVSSSE